MKILAFLLVFLLNLFKAAEHCPKRFNLSPENDVCVFTEKQDYATVRHKCKEMGGVVMKIRNAKENALILKHIKSEMDNVSPYIGVGKISNGTWLNSEGAALEYENWSLSSVGSASFLSVCANIEVENGKWTPSECTVPRPYLCLINKMDHVGDVPQCPSGWIYSKELEYCYFLKNFTYVSTKTLTSNGNVYADMRHLQTEMVSRWKLFRFDDARYECDEKNAQLASIHTRKEEKFIYDLLATNVKNLTSAVVDGDPCTYTLTFIGLKGNAKINGSSTWQDGSPMNFTGYPWGAPESNAQWALINDDSCGAREWRYNPVSAARYLCKMASLNRLESEN